MILVLVCYNDLISEVNLCKFKTSIFGKFSIDGAVIVNTKLNSISVYNAKGSILDYKISLDINREMEFSGYYDGVKFGINNFFYENEFLFLNDTVFSHGKLRKCEKVALNEYIYKSKLFRIARKNKKAKKIIGFKHKSSYLSKLEHFHDYVNSKFFITQNLNLKDYDKIFNLNRIHIKLSLEGVYENNIYQEKTYSDFLSSWLNKDGWYKSENLTEGNIVFFKKKARSIIHEHYMSDPKNNVFNASECLIKRSLIIRGLSKIIRFEY